MRIGKLKAHAIALFLQGKLRRVTLIVSPEEVLRLTQTLYDGKPIRTRPGQVQGVITAGRPNWRERRIINKMAARDFPKLVEQQLPVKKKKVS